LCLGADLAFEFLGDSPFPLKSFHPQMDFCPYYGGSATVCAELQAQLCRGA
jgi:hypothetical protein